MSSSLTDTVFCYIRTAPSNSAGLKEIYSLSSQLVSCISQTHSCAQRCRSVGPGRVCSRCDSDTGSCPPCSHTHGHTCCCLGARTRQRLYMRVRVWREREREKNWHDHKFFTNFQNMSAVKPFETGILHHVPLGCRFGNKSAELLHGKEGNCFATENRRMALFFHLKSLPTC